MRRFWVVGLLSACGGRKQIRANSYPFTKNYFKSTLSYKKAICRSFNFILATYTPTGGSAALAAYQSNNNSITLSDNAGFLADNTSSDQAFNCAVDCGQAGCGGASVIPEPGTIWLFAIGLIGGLVFVKRRLGTTAA